MSQNLAPIAVCNSLAYGRSTEEAQSALTPMGQNLQVLGQQNQTIAGWEMEGRILSRYLEEYSKNGLVNDAAIDDLIVLTHKLELYEKTQKSSIGVRFYDIKESNCY